METVKGYFAVVIGALLLLSGGSLAVAGQPLDDGFQFSEGSLGLVAEQSRLVVHNGNVTVWFQEYKPVIHICSPAEEGTNLSFSVALRGIYEIDESNTPVAFLDMFRAYPLAQNGVSSGNNSTSGVSVVYDQENEAIDVIFTLTADVLLLSPGQKEWKGQLPVEGAAGSIELVGPANVSVIYHVSTDTAFVKFDLIVSHWTWVNTESDRLVLIAAIEGHEVTDTFGQRPSVDGIPVGEHQGNETQLLFTVHNTYYRDSVRILGSELIDMGYLTWGDEATAIYDNGTVSTVAVTTYLFNCSYCEWASSHIWFIFSVPEGLDANFAALVYDPVIGVGELLPLSQNPNLPNQGGDGLPWYSLHLPSEFAAGLLIICIGVAAVVAAVMLVELLRRE